MCRGWDFGRVEVERGRDGDWFILMVHKSAQICSNFFLTEKEEWVMSGEIWYNTCIMITVVRDMI